MAALRGLAAALAGACLLAAAAAAPPSHVAMPLNSARSAPAWTMSNGAGNVSLKVSLPMMALQGMNEAGLVDDPLYRYNEREYRYVAEQVWTFERSFDVSAEMLAHAQLDLVVTGLDTVADVLVNGAKVARVENAHREHRISVKHRVTEGSNSVAFVIYPAILESFARNASYPYPAPILTYQVVAPYNFLRKPASDFGWDWGPAYAPSGVYGSVDLVAYTAGVLTGASAHQAHAPDGSWVALTFDAYVEAAAAGETGVVSVDGPWSASVDATLATAGLNVVPVTVNVTAPFDLWWPVGYGAQPLYDFTVTYTPTAGAGAGAPDAHPPPPVAESAKEAMRAAGVKSFQKKGGAAAAAAVTPAFAPSSVKRRIGLRTIELVRDALTNAEGEAFYFSVNGVPIFAKGSNMIPLHIFASKTTPADLREMVQASVDANMNMLRVWGGGLYPMDAFYDACDEAGMLVWQEAMFACAMYPRDPAFLEEVKKEVAYQARRINYHASLAVWGGNNEVEASLGWYEESRANRELYSNDYTALFVDTVRAALLSVSPHAVYLDSSPSKGVLASGPSFYVKRWGDVGDWKRGDVHFYTTTDNALNISTFPRAKFVSEFGFQSFPSWPVYKPDTEPQDWSYESPMTAFRQRHPGDTEDMLKQMAIHYQVPPAYAPPGSPPGAQEALFKKFIYLTQVYQACAYEVASTYWRRIKSEADAQTMGVLYWQLNDIWPGFSWTSIDYGGHWRLLHYAVKRFFAPVITSGEVDWWGASAHVTSDVNQRLSGELKIEVVDWASGADGAAVHTETTPFNLDPLDSRRVWKRKTTDILADAGGYPVERVFLRLTVQARPVGSGAKAAKGAAAGAAASPLHVQSFLQTRDGTELSGVNLAAALLRGGEEVLASAAAPAAPAAPAAGPHAAPSPAGKPAKRAAVEAAVQPLAEAAAPAAQPVASLGGAFAPPVGQALAAAAPHAPAGATWSSTFYLYFGELKDAALNPKPRLAASEFAQLSETEVSFTLSSKGVAAYVSMDTTIPGVFNDNAFHVLPWEPVTVTFKAKSAVTAADLQATLTLTSLADTLSYSSTLYN